MNVEFEVRLQNKLLVMTLKATSIELDCQKNYEFLPQSKRSQMSKYQTSKIYPRNANTFKIQLSNRCYRSIRKHGFHIQYLTQPHLVNDY